MDDKRLSRFILIYFLLIPVMWLLTEAVWGGAHGALCGIKIGKVLQDPKQLNEVTAFMKKHGISQSASRGESKAWVKNLSSEDKAEFDKLVMQYIKIEDIVTFGSAFAVCVIVFGLTGFISGAVTKTWLFAGFFPGISFLLNNPVIRFKSILHISAMQQAILVLAGQFLACYVFAFIGAFLFNKINERKRQKTESLIKGIETDAE